MEKRVHVLQPIECCIVHNGKQNETFCRCSEFHDIRRLIFVLVFFQYILLISNIEPIIWCLCFMFLCWMISCAWHISSRIIFVRFPCSFIAQSLGRKNIMKKKVTIKRQRVFSYTVTNIDFCPSFLYSRFNFIMIMFLTIIFCFGGLDQNVLRFYL